MSDAQVAGSWRGALASLGRGARVALGIGVASAVVLVIAALFWLMRTDYQVLFSQLSETDAAAIVDQLKRAKEPYRIAQGGSAIEVPTDRVHETRLALMSSGTPLAGGVGFEIFDRQGLGATEQSQRVSYQRALQGELTRTIAALEGVSQARVHLVMPESSLFRRDRQEPRAAVTLAVEPATRLTREQVAGIQRLVAASVAGLSPARVVVADQRGLTLTGVDALAGPDLFGGGTGVGETRLAMKRQVEEYLTRKIVELLDRAFGPGRALVTVDATLNFDEVRRTVQDFAPGSDAGGALLQRRQATTRGEAPPDDDIFSEPRPAGGRSSSSEESTFDPARRLEQVVAAPGGLTRLSVGVVVPGALDPDRRARIVALVRAAAGLDPRRGDTVVVESLAEGAATSGTASPQAVGVPTTVPTTVAAAPIAAGVAVSPTGRPVGVLAGWVGWLSIGALGIAIAAAVLAWRARARAAVSAAADRDRLLADLERALAAADTAASTGEPGARP